MRVLIDGVTVTIDESSTLARLLRAKLARTLGLKPSVLKAMAELGLSTDSVLETAKRKAQRDR